MLGPFFMPSVTRLTHPVGTNRSDKAPANLLDLASFAAVDTAPFFLGAPHPLFERRKARVAVEAIGDLIPDARLPLFPVAALNGHVVKDGEYLGLCRRHGYAPFASAARALVSHSS